jgi:hypothetical protein
MKIQANNSGVSCMDKLYVTTSFFLMVAFYGAIPLGIITQNETFFAIMSVYIIYLIWSCCHPATKYISNLTTIEQNFVNIQAAIKSPPQIYFTI